MERCMKEQGKQLYPDVVDQYNGRPAQKDNSFVTGASSTAL